MASTWMMGGVPSAARRDPPKTKSGMREILARDVSIVSALNAGHGVYLLTFTDGEKVVVKREMGYIGSWKPSSFNVGAEFMGKLNGTKAEALSEAETVEIGKIRTVPEEFKALKTMVSQGQIFLVKAPMIAGVREFDVNQKGVSCLKFGHRLDIAELHQRLVKNRAAWMSLGQISAVDHFIGNDDRIDVFNGEVNNPGNLIFQQTTRGDIEKAVGLDHFDPANSGRGGNFSDPDLGMWVEQQGLVLRNPHAFEPNFRKAIEHLNRQLKEMAKLDSQFGAIEANALMGGFSQGANVLRQQTSGAGGAGKGLPGIQARLLFLGWASGPKAMPAPAPSMGGLRSKLPFGRKG